MSNEKGTLSIEEQGIDTISEEERKGTPASLFWPWFAANVSMFAMSYGAWALGFGWSASFPSRANAATRPPWCSPAPRSAWKVPKCQRL